MQAKQSFIMMLSITLVGVGNAQDSSSLKTYKDSASSDASTTCINESLAVQTNDSVKAQKFTYNK